MSDAVPTVVIVGAGFSGAMVAAHLLRDCRSPLRVVLLESRGAIGRGLAYSTLHDRHVLNVPCSKMGAWPEDLGGFHRWASARIPGLPEGAFVSRGLYGQYIESQLRDAEDRAGPGVELEVVPMAAVDLRWRGTRALVELENRQPLQADHVVLAMGSGPARLPLPLLNVAQQTDRVVSLPFAPGALGSVAEGDRVLILGTGLTMYDTVIALRDQGHRGQILAVSRRGRTPFAHAPSRPPHWASAWSSSLDSIGTVKGVVREVREACDRAEREGTGWRGVIDSMRPHLPAIWASWSIDERVRFLKWAAPFWDAVRHRCAPEVAREIDDLRGERHLSIERARVRSFELIGQEIEAEFASRSGDGPDAQRFDRVLVCAGPESDVKRWPNPLMKSLLAQGLVTPDPLRLGVRTAGDGGVVGSDGEPVDWLSLVGPLRKADLWENTAVPELRTGAADTAKRIMQRMSRSASLGC